MVLGACVVVFSTCVVVFNSSCAVALDVSFRAWVVIFTCGSVVTLSAISSDCVVVFSACVVVLIA